jgi:hypothetical protein
MHIRLLLLDLFTTELTSSSLSYSKNTLQGRWYQLDSSEKAQAPIILSAKAINAN